MDTHHKKEPALFRKAGLIQSLVFRYTPLNLTGFSVDPADVNSGPHKPEPCAVLETVFSAGSQPPPSRETIA
ncbi:MAG TPA: hypothetical protein VFY83_04880, partial [Anaerolineales bacterium]|nr:hypothetical protein [Anaerolineales bacterium]